VAGSNQEDVTLSGDLASAVAGLPDDMALDFLREYHGIMCDCGDSAQDEHWLKTLQEIRAGWPRTVTLEVEPLMVAQDGEML
jgi:hypothetical protein